MVMTTKIRRDMGGDRINVGDGGVIHIEVGGCLTCACKRKVPTLSPDAGLPEIISTVNGMADVMGSIGMIERNQESETLSRKGETPSKGKKKSKDSAE